MIEETGKSDATSSTRTLHRKLIGIADTWLRKAETEPTDLPYEVEKLLKRRSPDQLLTIEDCAQDPAPSSMPSKKAAIGIGTASNSARLQILSDAAVLVAKGCRLKFSKSGHDCSNSGAGQRSFANPVKIRFPLR
jgi:hypothetical protein